MSAIPPAGGCAAWFRGALCFLPSARRTRRITLVVVKKALFLLWTAAALASVSRAETYLVLPFFNLSGNANLDWIGESLAGNIHESLASEGVLALDREDRLEAYRRLSIRPNSRMTKASVVRLGTELDASAVIYGSYELTAPESGQGRGTIRITAQILNLQKLSGGPEFMELGALDDLARLQTHLGWQTLQFVLPDRAPAEEEYRRRRPLLRVEAIEYYTRGLLASSAEQKLKLFSQALRLEPTFSQANFQMGRIHWDKKGWKLAAEHFLRVLPYDSRFREATFLLGICRYRLGDYGGAQQAFAQVAKEVPLGEVLNNLAAAQSRKNLPDALENFEKALEGDRNDPDYHFNVGYSLYKRGNLADAAERFRAVLDRAPGDAQAITMLGRCLQKAPGSRRDYALEGMERLKESYEEGAYLQLKAMLEPKKVNK